MHLGDRRRDTRAISKTNQLDDGIMSSESAEFDGLGHEEEQRRDELGVRNASPKLVKALARLTNEQRSSIKEMGFGQICYLKITEMPREFATWLIDAFDPKKCGFVLENEFVEITPWHVHKILGFPYGGEQVAIPNRVDPTCRIVQKWREELQLSGGSVTPAALIQEMERHTTGRKWFKRHFMVLFYSTMVENLRNGNCNLRILTVLHKTKKIPDYDWCKVILDRAKRGKQDLLYKRSRSYSGPLILLAEALDIMEDDLRYKAFKKVVEEELEDKTGKTIREIDMVFFPMWESGDYYVIVVNLQKQTIEILDNDLEDWPQLEKYVGMPSALIDEFINYLNSVNYLKADVLRGVEIKRIKLKWGTLKNSVDSGIFAMKHMETYQGNKGAAWRSQLPANNKSLTKTMNLLRTAYVTKMLTSPINDMALDISMRSAEFALLPKEKRDKISANRDIALTERGRAITDMSD